MAIGGSGLEEVVDLEVLVLEIWWRLRQDVGGGKPLPVDAVVCPEVKHQVGPARFDRIRRLKAGREIIAAVKNKDLGGRVVCNIRRQEGYIPKHHTLVLTGLSSLQHSGGCCNHTQVIKVAQVSCQGVIKCSEKT